MLVIALAAGWVALIIAGGVLLALALIAFAIWAHQYTNVGPNEVLIISGRRGRRKGPGYRIVRGGGTYVRPFSEKVQRLSLELMQFDVRTAETYTMHGVQVQVDGVAMVKIASGDEDIEHAAEQFLSRGREDIVRTALQAVEGHMRTAVGSLSVEDIERRKAIEILHAEVERRKRELEAEVIEPAIARAREITEVAEAERERAAALGAGEAEALRAKGLAEAEAMAAKAESWRGYN